MLEEDLMLTSLLPVQFAVTAQDKHCFSSGSQGQQTRRLEYLKLSQSEGCKFKLRC